MSGDFTVVNAALVRDLKARGLWDEVMVSDLKYYDGSVGPIDRIPDDLKALYATAFEIAPAWLIEAAARRQKWIDQAQSLNIYVANPSGRVLDETYRLAWKRGLKTTYYLRARSASHVLVEAGDLIPGDGEIVEGIASVNEAAITGESAPVIRESGGDRSAVTGGTTVISDWLVVRITAAPGSSFLDRMIALVEGAERQKTPNELALSVLLVGMPTLYPAKDTTSAEPSPGANIARSRSPNRWVLRKFSSGTPSLPISRQEL